MDLWFGPSLAELVNSLRFVLNVKRPSLKSVQRSDVAWMKPEFSKYWVSTRLIKNERTPARRVVTFDLYTTV